MKTLNWKKEKRTALQCFADWLAPLSIKYKGSCPLEITYSKTAFVIRVTPKK